MRFLALGCALACMPLAAVADEPVDAAQRIEEIRAQSRELAELAREPLPDSLAEKERRSAEAYQKWLESTSLELAAFADRWERKAQDAAAHATTRSGDGEALEGRAGSTPTRQIQETDLAFLRQRAQLHERLSQQSRAFGALGPVAKALQESATNAIENRRE